jgi:hypothetical protein
MRGEEPDHGSAPRRMLTPGSFILRRNGWVPKSGSPSWSIQPQFQPAAIWLGRWSESSRAMAGRPSGATGPTDFTTTARSPLKCWALPEDAAG